MSVDANLDRFIGKGLKFPLTLNSKGTALISEGDDLIKESLKSILSWPLGTRFFLGEFGSRIHELLEEPDDRVTEGLVRNFVIDAINIWEKRIEILEISFSHPNDGRMDIIIKYRISNRRIESTFVFPFYREIKF